MKMSKTLLMMGALGVLLLSNPQVQADACGCTVKSCCVEKCCVEAPCCKNKCCKQGFGGQIASGIATIFEGTGDAIAWPFRKIGEIG
jgi:hypothetical protein